MDQNHQNQQNNEFKFHTKVEFEALNFYKLQELCSKDDSTLAQNNGFKFHQFDRNQMWLFSLRTVGTKCGRFRSMTVVTK